MDLPEGFRPILALVNHQNCLGNSSWYEVVYFNSEIGEWESYQGSKTFLDGEIVSAWNYADELPLHA